MNLRRAAGLLAAVLSLSGPLEAAPSSRPLFYPGASLLLDIRCDAIRRASAFRDDTIRPSTTRRSDDCATDVEVTNQAADLEAPSFQFFSHADHAALPVGAQDFSAWLYYSTEAPAGTKMLMSQWGNSAGEEAWKVAVSSAGSGHVQFSLTSNGSDDVLVAAANPGTEWDVPSCMVVTYDFSTTTATVRVTNTVGTVTGTSALMPGSIQDSAVDFNVGAEEGARNFHNGWVNSGGFVTGDVLSTAEQQFICDAYATPKTPAEIAANNGDPTWAWPFDSDGSAAFGEALTENGGPFSYVPWVLP